MKSIVKIGLISCIVLIATLNGCKKETPDTSSVVIEKINGIVEKGPFLNGSSVTLFELNANGNQTGSSYNTQTIDNFGAFELNNITLATNHAVLKADGYFYDEVNDENSTAPISIYALCEINANSNVNINILTHLEKDRIFYLMNNGMPFSQAKSQVKSELYEIFKFGYPSILNAENLNITGTDEENAILLATSLIFRGATRSISDFSQLMADFIVDFKTDGQINNAAIGTELVNDAKFLNLSDIRNNLESNYSGTIIPDFEKYVNRFTDSTSFVFTRIIQYPDSGNPVMNLLSESIFVYPNCVQPNNGITVGIFADLPEHTSLRVYFADGFMNGSNMNLGYPYSVGGWQCTYMYSMFELKTVQTGYVAYHQTLCFSADSGTVYIYENSDTIPTRIKHIIKQ